MNFGTCVVGNPKFKIHIPIFTYTSFMLRRSYIIAASLVGLGCVSLLLWYFSVQPSNDRVWAADQRVLPVAEFADDTVTVRNVRNFRYRSTTEYDIAYEDRTYDLSAPVSLWYIVEPFSDWEGAAHTFLSFGFADGEFVSISIEIRKEEGEEFSAWKGLLRQYEIMYVVADERDVIALRTNHRKDDVFLYPIRASDTQIRSLFVSMLQRANELALQPEFYNTLTNTCMTGIVSHLNALVENDVSLWDRRVLAPGYSDTLAYELELIETDLPLEEIRSYFRINDLAAQYADDPEFSHRIRKEGS